MRSRGPDPETVDHLLALIRLSLKGPDPESARVYVRELARLFAGTR